MIMSTDTYEAHYIQDVWIWHSCMCMW